MKKKTVEEKVKLTEQQADQKMDDFAATMIQGGASIALLALVDGKVLATIPRNGLLLVTGLSAIADSLRKMGLPQGVIDEMVRADSDIGAITAKKVSSDDLINSMMKRKGEKNA